MARRINSDLSEKLFRAWFNGENLWDLYIHHKDTSEHFSYRSLLRLKEDYKWEDRRKALIDEYRRRNDEDILIEKRKAQLSMSLIFDMINEILIVYHKQCFANPEAFARNITDSNIKPFWLVNSVFEFKELLSCQNIILNGM